MMKNMQRLKGVRTNGYRKEALYSVQKTSQRRWHMPKSAVRKVHAAERRTAEGNWHEVKTKIF
jgi:hypothetical protein